MHKILNFIKKYRYEIIIVVVAAVIYHGWILPGVLVGADFQYRPLELFRDYQGFGTWDPSLNGGYYTTFAGQLNKAPIFVITGLLSNLFSYGIIQRLVWFIPFLLLSFFGMRTLANYIFRDNKQLTFYATLFFLINPTVIERFYRGHVWFTMVYAITPFAIYFLIRAMHDRSFRYVFLTALALSVSLMFEIRTAILQGALLCALALFIFYKTGKKQILSNILTSLKILLLTLFLNAFWILPFVLAKPGATFDEGIMTYDAIKGAAAYTGDLFQVFQFYPKSWEAFYLPIVSVIVILMVVPLISKTFKNYQFLGFFYILVLIFLFLGKGSVDPLGDAFVWMAQNIPYFIGYRVSNKFLLIIAPLYALISGLGFAIIYKKLHGTFKPVRPLLVIAAILVLLASNSLLLSGYANRFNYTDSTDLAVIYRNEPNMFNPLQPEAQYEQIWQTIKASEGDSRSLWFPKVSRYRYATNTKPQLLAGSSLFSAQDPSLDNLLTNRKGSYFTDNNFNDLAVLMKLWKVKFLVVRKDDELDWNYSSGLKYQDIVQMLENQSDLERIPSEQPYQTRISDPATYELQTSGSTAVINGTSLVVTTVAAPEANSADIVYRDPNLIYDNRYLRIDATVKQAETINITICNNAGQCQPEFLRFTNPGRFVGVIAIRPDLVNIKKISIGNLLKDNEITVSDISFLKGSSLIYKNALTQPETLSVTGDSVFADYSVMATCADLTALKTNDSILPIAALEFVPEEKRSSQFVVQNCTELNNLANSEVFRPADVTGKWQTAPENGLFENDNFKNKYKLKAEVNNTGFSYTLDTAIPKEAAGSFLYFNSEQSENVFIDVVDSNGTTFTTDMELLGDLKPQILALDLSLLSDLKQINVRGVVQHNVVEMSQLLFKQKIVKEPASFGQLPMITISELGGSRYLIKVRSAGAPFYLNFQQSFDKYWQLSAETGSGTVEVTKHTMLNGYANSWYVEKSGDYNLILEFTPQNLYVNGVIVSATALISGLLIVFVGNDRKKYKEN